MSRLVCLVSLDVRRSNYSKRVSVERSPRCIPIYSSNFDFTNVRNIVFRYRLISSNFSRDHWRVDRLAAITVRRSRKKEGSAAMRTYGTGHMCGPRHEMKKPFIYVSVAYGFTVYTAPMINRNRWIVEDKAKYTLDKFPLCSRKTSFLANKEIFFILASFPLDPRRYLRSRNK